MKLASTMETVMKKLVALSILLTVAAPATQAFAGPNFPCTVQWAEQLNMLEVKNDTTKTYPTGTKFAVDATGPGLSQHHVVTNNAPFPPGAQFPLDQAPGDPRSLSCTAHLKR